MYKYLFLYFCDRHIKLLVNICEESEEFMLMFDVPV